MYKATGITRANKRNNEPISMVLLSFLYPVFLGYKAIDFSYDDSSSGSIML
jgi:hypothetical protein